MGGFSATLTVSREGAFDHNSIHCQSWHSEAFPFSGFIDEHKTTMEIEVRKMMNYKDYESILYSRIFVGTVGL
jgi:hypothetical protein